MFRIAMLPAEDGDCFLVETGAAASPHRILIDGGRKRTATRFLPPLLQSLPQRQGPLLDILVLTHIDADHIEGFLSLPKAAGMLTIGDVWFNGGPQMEMIAGLREPPKSREEAAQLGRVAAVPSLSVTQASEFSRVIADGGWRWNSQFLGGPIAIEPSGSLPRFALPNGGELILLGPPRAKLRSLCKVWEEAFAKGKVPALGRERPVPRPGNVEHIAQDRDEADDKVPNGASLVFVLEYEGRRVLFAADAHPADVADALSRYLVEGGPAKFDAVKVAHHGSAANNTSQLIDRLESPLWLVSSNGVRHGHPDPEAIARIVLTTGGDKRIVFNYLSEFNKVWKPKELAAHYRYRPEFGDGKSPVVVDLI